MFTFVNMFLSLAGRYGKRQMRQICARLAIPSGIPRDYPAALRVCISVMESNEYYADNSEEGTVYRLRDGGDPICAGDIPVTSAEMDGTTVYLVYDVDEEDYLIAYANGEHPEIHLYHPEDINLSVYCNFGWGFQHWFKSCYEDDLPVTYNVKITTNGIAYCKMKNNVSVEYFRYINEDSAHKPHSTP
jgi:hypothetical protein